MDNLNNPCEVTTKTYMSKKELYSFAIAAGGQGMVYAMMSSYISDFYTNVLLVSPLFVFILMLASRIWDAVNDPIMGIIVDKTNTKFGKMKPYLLITPIPIAILTVLIFLTPDISVTGKMVYASITYVLWGMIYTVSDIPFWSIVNLSTPNPKEKGKTISVGRTVNGIGSAIPQALMIIVPMIVALFISKEGLTDAQFEWRQYKYSYLISAIFVAIVGMLLFVRYFFYAKERVIPIKKDNVPLKMVFHAMAHNKPLILVVIMGILSFTRYMIQAGSIHVARYAFTNVSISQTILIFGIAIAVGMFGTMIFLPKLFKKFNYKQLIIFSGILGFAVDIAMFFVGCNRLDDSNILYILLPFLILSGIPLGVYNIVSFAMISDSIDYMEWKSGERLDGVTSACQTFVNKLGNAFATSFIVLLYVLINLDPVKYVAGQSAITPSIQLNMFALISIYPAIGLLISIIPIFFYDFVGEKKDKVVKELYERRKSANGEIE